MSGFLPSVTPAVKYLLIANTAIFVITFLLSQKLIALFGLVPVMVWKGAAWQPITYMFLHGGIGHLLFNMLVLWMFGSALESDWGWKRFLNYYFLCGIGAGMLNTLLTPSSAIPIVGSSGAVYGLLLAFGALYPNQMIYFLGIFPLRAKYFVIIIGALELMTSFGSSQGGVAHIVHLGGMGFGLVYLKWRDWRSALSARQREKRRERHLSVVYDRSKELHKVQAELDAILDRAAKHGIESLSGNERARFDELSQKKEKLENMQ